MSAGGIVTRFLDESPGAQAPLAGVEVGALWDARVYPMERVIVAIGNGSARRRIALKLLDSGCNLTTVIHPFAYVAPDAVLNRGAVVLAGAIVESRASIGEGAIIDVGAIIDHDASVSAFVHVRPGQIIAAHGLWPTNSDGADDDVSAFGVGSR